MTLQEAIATILVAQAQGILTNEHKAQLQGALVKIPKCKYCGGWEDPDEVTCCCERNNP